MQKAKDQRDILLQICLRYPSTSIEDLRWFSLGTQKSEKERKCPRLRLCSLKRKTSYKRCQWIETLLHAQVHSHHLRAIKRKLLTMAFIATWSKRCFVDRMSERMEVGMSKHILTMQKIQHDQEIFQLKEFMCNSNRKEKQQTCEQ